MLVPTVLVLLLSTFLLALGLFLPCMSIQPQFGEFTSLVTLFNKDFSRLSEVSIMSGITTLFSEGKYFLGAILLFFSIIFPLWKLSVLWQSVCALYFKQPLGGMLYQVERLAKFSMLDIFVIAVFILAVKGLPGGTEVEMKWGLIAFAISVLISMRLPSKLRTLEEAAS